MAKRNVHEKGDPTLEKRSRLITDFNVRLHTLLDDMKDTLVSAGGVGLAAPQVGVLRRAAVVMETNVENEDDEFIIELINPEIIDSSGEQTGPEGCLSLPGKYGIVVRPEHVKVRAQDRNGNTFDYVGDGLTARCLCHEIDHLEGVLFTDRVERMLTPAEIEGEK